MTGSNVSPTQPRTRFYGVLLGLPTALRPTVMRSMERRRETKYCYGDSPRPRRCIRPFATVRPSVSSSLQITNRSFRYASSVLTCGICSLLHSVNLILFTLLVHLILHMSSHLQWRLYMGGRPPSKNPDPPTFASVTSCIICDTRIRCSYVRMTCIMHSETCIVFCN